MQRANKNCQTKRVIMMLAGLTAITAAFQEPVLAQNIEPWRLQKAIDAPAWLSVSGETRMRYETLSNQFRAGGTGDDQALFFRTLLKVEAKSEPVTFGIELQDSRGYLTDDGTPLSNSFVNPIDVLQAYAKFELDGLIAPSWQTEAIIGRQTVSIGSKRQIERVSYANVIKNYTGIHTTSVSERGDEMHLLFVSPVGRKPGDRPRIDTNRVVFDREQFGRKIWAVHYRRANALPQLLQNIWAEAFVYGLFERDTSGTPTPNRRYVTPGIRVFKKPQPGEIDIDLEGALRFGKRRASNAATDVTDLDVKASQLLARVGYTFERRWSPRIALQYYWASGDENPNDDRFDQYERLFGSRRTDLNNTSIHGPLTPANLSALGVRFNVEPTDKIDARLHYSAAFLASATDQFVIGKQRDPSGNSGDFLGHTLDGRVRYHLAPENVILEFGASAFLFGEYTQSVPQGPLGERTLFAYGQATVKF